MLKHWGESLLGALLKLIQLMVLPQDKIGIFYELMKMTGSLCRLKFFLKSRVHRHVTSPSLWLLDNSVVIPDQRERAVRLYCNAERPGFTGDNKKSALY